MSPEGSRLPRLIAAFAAALFSLPAEAQVPHPPVCPPTVVIPGGSNPEDQTIHRCSLDAQPALLSSVEDLPAPTYRRQAHGTLTLVVDPDGRVNAHLTRYLTRSADEDFHDRLLQALRGLEFEVGTVDGAPARAGHELVVQTGLRSDTSPERLTWRYVPGELADSLVGTWVRAEPDPPLSTDQVSSIAQSVTRYLMELGVLIPEQGQPYCIRFEGDDRETVEAAIRQELRGAPPGCAFDVNARRFRVDAPVQTGGGRSVVAASGDFLPHWPPGLEGRWWRAWTANCVQPGAGDEGHGTRCEVSPVPTGDGSIDWQTRGPFPGPPDPLAPVQLMVVVANSGAFRTDTIRASVAAVPSLEERALFRPDARQCRGRATWGAETDRPTGGEFVMWLRLPVDAYSPGFLNLTEVRGRPPDAGFSGIRCDEADAFEGPMAAFTLGGVGEPLQGPVRFCVNEPNCTQVFEVDPGVHELAPAPHAAFRLEDLRESARTGVWQGFRLHVDRRIEGLIPFVLVRSPERPLALMLRAETETEFDFRLNRDPPLPPETEFWIYLVTVGG
jgi:hypothetical protein